MIVTGWHGGQADKTQPAGYGIRISKHDRELFFKRDWDSVALELDDGPTITVKLTESFWRKCSELRSAQIGRWMMEHSLAPWPKGHPPKMKLELLSVAEFRLKQI